MFNPQKKPKVYVLKLREERLERNFVLGQVQVHLSQTASYVGIGILLRLALFAITSSKLKNIYMCVCVWRVIIALGLGLQNR